MLYVWKEIISNPNSDKNPNHLLACDTIKAVWKIIAAFVERSNAMIFEGVHFVKLSHFIFLNMLWDTIVKSFSNKRIPSATNLAVFET